MFLELSRAPIYFQNCVVTLISGDIPWNEISAIYGKRGWWSGWPDSENFRPLGDWVLWAFLKITEWALIFGLLFSTAKFIRVLILTQNGVGYIYFGRFFHKLIRSHWWRLPFWIFAKKNWGVHPIPDVFRWVGPQLWSRFHLDANNDGPFSETLLNLRTLKFSSRIDKQLELYESRKSWDTHC
jgi:hypothetical protein